MGLTIWGVITIELALLVYYVAMLIEGKISDNLYRKMEKLGQKYGAKKPFGINAARDWSDSDKKEHKRLWEAQHRCSKSELIDFVAAAIFALAIAIFWILIAGLLVTFAFFTHNDQYGWVENEYNIEAIGISEMTSGVTYITLEERGEVAVPTKSISPVYDADKPYAVLKEIVQTEPDFLHWGVEAECKEIILHLPPGEY